MDASPYHGITPLRVQLLHLVLQMRRGARVKDAWNRRVLPSLFTTVRLSAPVPSIHNSRFSERLSFVSNVASTTHDDVVVRLLCVPNSHKAHVVRHEGKQGRESYLVVSRKQARQRSGYQNSHKQHGKGREARHYPPDDGCGTSRDGPSRNTAKDSFISGERGRRNDGAAGLLRC